MPDAVKASDDGGFRGHERITEPDGEDRVLLAEGLAGSDRTDLAAPLLRHPDRGTLTLASGNAARAIAASDKTSRRKLEDAADKGDQRYHKKQSDMHVAPDNGFGRHSDRQGQRHSP